MLQQNRAVVEIRKVVLPSQQLGSQGDRATRYVAEFMLQTGLLGQFRQAETEEEYI